MSTLSHLDCHSSKYVKGSGYSVMRRREKLERKPEQTEWEIEGGEVTKGMMRTLKLYFVIYQGLLKVQMM